MNPSEKRSTPDLTQLLENGIQAAQQGNKARARELLTQATEIDPTNEEAWLWLAGVAGGPEDTEMYLRTVLALDPKNPQAQQGLRWNEDRDGPESSLTIERRTSPPAPAAPSIPPPPEISPGFVLSEEQAERIDTALERMAYDSEASCIILADMTGQLISERGRTCRMNTQVLSALAAGELAATHEMARLVGEKARFKLLLHEGEKRSVYLSDVGEELILVIVFDVETPIGLVRMILKQAVDELAPIIEEARRSDGEGQIDQALGGDFAQTLEGELDSSLRFDL
jgi:predicted regulator of Ras-like GTPase activity (Roadblock/LC7/MglB family)